LKGLEENPKNDRYTFYLANSYRDHGDHDKAIEYYKKRIDIGGWYEEIWHSYYSIGKCYRAKGDMVNAIHWWMDQPREPKRAEGDASGFLYSNLGYMALGGVLEQLRDEDWEKQIRERLFSPLGMDSAGFGIPSKPLGDKAPWGHIRPVGLLVAVERDNPQSLGPAGTVYASMEDWVRYLQVHLRRKSSQTPVLKLSEESFDRLHQPDSGESYAGGWNVIRRGWSSGPIYTHNGSNTVWYCVVFLAPAEGRGIFAASNFGLDAAGPCDEALQWMLKNLPFDSEVKSP
jgi:CubicO group peptidase (beta-lactamase class C family)